MDIEAIGTVVSDFTDPEDLHIACEQGIKFELVSRILLKEHLAGGLDGLSEFSHVWIIYHLNKADKTEIRTLPGPASVQGLSEVGVFASRSQYRPNHIALRLVRLLGIYENVIEVQGLDAIDGSPVLDIKPFVKGFDYPENPKTADWYGWLDNENR